MKLIYRDGPMEVLKGDLVKLDGEDWEVVGISKPTSPASTGRVHIKNLKTGQEHAYYPSVIKAEWIGREDRS